MFYWLWFRRVLLSPRYMFQFSSVFSLLSLILGVASLTTAVLAINGFSLSLEKAIVDMSGHILVSLDSPKKEQEVAKDVAPYDSFIKDQLSFLSSEGLIFHSKKFKGVRIEGFKTHQLQSSQFLKNRILKGNLNNSRDFLIIGTSLAKELDLKIGSSVPLIISDRGDDLYFSRKQKIFKIQAIGDFGRYDFNSGYVLMPLSSLQNLTQKRHYISGMRLWLKHSKLTESLSLQMSQKMDTKNYMISSWKDIDRSLFEVIDMDKKIIFLVLFILILAAGFNVSSSLFIQVFKKTKDISILRSLGGTQTFIRNLFLLNGLVLGLVGICLGLLLGWSICYGLIMLQDIWNFIPEEVYQVNQIILQWDMKDFLFIGCSSLIIVLLSSILPAKKAYQMQITKGLLYK